jgi:hypothetical protein
MKNKCAILLIAGKVLPGGADCRHRSNPGMRVGGVGIAVYAGVR